MTSDDTEYSIQVRLSQLNFISEPFVAVKKTTWTLPLSAYQTCTKSIIDLQTVVGSMWCSSVSLFL